MKVIRMIIMVMGNTLEVKQFVLLLLFMRHKRTKACKGQRLPAHAKNEKHCDQLLRHELDVTSDQQCVRVLSAQYALRGVRAIPFNRSARSVVDSKRSRSCHARMSASHQTVRAAADSRQG